MEDDGGFMKRMMIMKLTGFTDSDDNVHEDAWLIVSTQEGTMLGRVLMVNPKYESDESDMENILSQDIGTRSRLDGTRPRWELGGEYNITGGGWHHQVELKGKEKRNILTLTDL